MEFYPTTFADLEQMANDRYERIRQEVKRIIERDKLTIGKMAERIGVCRPALTHFLNGKNNQISRGILDTFFPCV